MLKIPFHKPSIGVEEIDEVVATLKSGWFTTGPRTQQFEREFAERIKHTRPRDSMINHLQVSKLASAVPRASFWNFVIRKRRPRPASSA